MIPNDTSVTNECVGICFCRLFNVDARDSGRYVCTVSNEAGTTRDYAQLSVEQGIIESCCALFTRVRRRIMAAAIRKYAQRVKLVN